jgi:uncharacterized protein YlzI (FlbEa/FlbD family)
MCEYKINNVKDLIFFESKYDLSCVKQSDKIVDFISEDTLIYTQIKNLLLSSNITYEVNNKYTVIKIELKTNDRLAFLFDYTKNINLIVDTTSDRYLIKNVFINQKKIQSINTNNEYTIVLYSSLFKNLHKVSDKFFNRITKNSLTFNCKQYNIHNITDVYIFKHSLNNILISSDKIIDFNVSPSDLVFKSDKISSFNISNDQEKINSKFDITILDIDVNNQVYDVIFYGNGKMYFLNKTSIDTGSVINTSLVTTINMVSDLINNKVIEVDTKIINKFRNTYE